MAAAAIPLISTGISALAGLFGGRKKTPEQTNTTTIDSTNTSTPNLTAQQQGLIDMLVNNYSKRLQSGTDLSGYAGAGLRQINSSSDSARKMSDNILASRGLSNSPYAAFRDIAVDNARGTASADLLNSLPLLQRQMQGEDLGGLSRLFSMIPTGYTSTNKGTSTQKGTQIIPGNMTAGLFSGLDAGLGTPANGQGDTNASQIAGLLGGIFGKRQPLPYDAA